MGCDSRVVELFNIADEPRGCQGGRSGHDPRCFGVTLDSAHRECRTVCIEDQSASCLANFRRVR